ncbi:hypothetical protein D3C85_766830 [compost metagenome]
MLGGGGLVQLAFQLRDLAVGDLGRATEVPGALGGGQFGAQTVQGLAQLGALPHLVLLGFPAGGHVVRLALEVGDLVLQLLQTLLRGVVALLLQGLALDLELDQTAVDFVQRLGLGIDGHAHARRGLVDQVDGLVGQEAVGDVAVRQGGGGDDGAVGNAHPVVDLVLLFQAAQDRHRVLDGGLRHEDRLEATGQGRVLLDVLAVFIQRGGADAVQLAARQSGLQEVGGVHGPVALAGADQGVHLVDEEDDAALGLGHLVQHGLQPLLELAAVFGARDQGAHVQRQDLLVLQAFGHVAVDDAQGQTFDDGGLADAGFADQDGVVLGATGQDLDGAADLLVAADDGVDLAVARGLGQVAGVAFQGVVAVLGAGAVGGLALAHLGDGFIQLLGRDAGGFQRLGGGPALLGDGGQQAFGRDEGVAGLFRGLLGGAEDAGGVAVQIELARAALDLGPLLQQAFGDEFDGGRVAAGLVDQLAGQTVAFLQQHLQQVLGRELLVPPGERQRLGGLDGLFGAVGIEVEIHGVQSPRKAENHQSALRRSDALSCVKPRWVWRIGHASPVTRD